jgi:hypothetical protein
LPRMSSSLMLSSATPLDVYVWPHERWSTSSERPSLAPLSGCPPPSPTHASHR